MQIDVAGVVEIGVVVDVDGVVVVVGAVVVVIGGGLVDGPIVDVVGAKLSVIGIQYGVKQSVFCTV